MSYNIHPFAATYPIETATVQKMAEDMRANGFDSAHPVIVDDLRAMVIDGRTRLEAARIAGVEPVFEHLGFNSDAEIVDFIRRANDIRRGGMNRYQKLHVARLQAEYLIVVPTAAELRKASGLHSSADVARALALWGTPEGDELWRGERQALPVKAPRKRAPAAPPAGVSAAEAPAPKAQLLDFASQGDRIAIEQGTDDAVAALDRTRRRAAVAGWAPEFGWTNPVPEPHIAKGVSTLYGKDGSVKLSWVKSSLSEARAMQTMQIALEELAAPLQGLGALPPPPEHADEDLLNVYLLGDPHIGMLAWAKETLGEDYDVSIAEHVHVDAMRRLVAESPPAGEALVVNMGDALHADNYDFLTKSGHRLDADSRYPRMVAAAVRIMRRTAEAAASRHPMTHWKNVSGNHDRNSTPWLNEALRGYWSNEPRIRIDTSPTANLKHRFGNVLIGLTHGDRLRGRFAKKSMGAQDLLAVMANDWAKDWGECEHRYGFQGHVHSSNRIEATGGILESVQTLASTDAWHAAQIYRSGKSVTRITFHRQHGEIGRGRVPVSMVRGEKPA